MDSEIAIATVPCQQWSEPYDLAKALKEGTIFPELNKPFLGNCETHKACMQSRTKKRKNACRARMQK